MGSLSHASAPSGRIVTVCEPLGSRGSPVTLSGCRTDWPLDLVSESVNRTKVASRKKMTSISGMISMRARFLPPELEPPLMGNYNTGVKRRNLLSADLALLREGRGGFRFLDDKLKRVEGIIDLVSCFLDTGVKVIVRKKASHSDEETAAGGDERLGHAAGDLAGVCANVAGAQCAEGAHHACHGAKQAEQRGGCNHRVERGETLVEACHLLVGRPDEGVGERE